jgi:hypothetical protein
MLSKANILGHNRDHIHVFDAKLDIKVKHVSRNSAVGLLALGFHNHNLVFFKIEVNKVSKVVGKQKLCWNIVLKQSWKPLYVFEHFPSYFLM